MTSTTPAARDWGATMFLPKTDFPMRAGLPQLEPKLLERWAKLGMYQRLRETAKGKPKFILHDGPPYANGNIHIGTALNKILKDMVTRCQQMLGFDSNYVPGWDCHGLPIEWQIEQEYRAKGKRKEDVPVLQLIDECRAFAPKWIDIQRAEFKRLGVEGDWDHPYMTMAPAAEAQIARELMKFAATGQLYRGSKPVMWSVVEKTALAEAEIEYHDYTSDTVWVKFPVDGAERCGIAEIASAAAMLEGASVVIWTTTPWTLPGNRAISFNSKIEYGLYEVTKAPEGNWAKAGDRLVWPTSLPTRHEVGEGREPSSCRARSSIHAVLMLRASAARPRLRLRRPPARWRSRHRRGRHRLRAHRARPRPRRLRDLDGQSGQADRARHRHGHPLHRRRRRRLHPRGARLRGQARAQGQRRQGRRQRRRHQGAAGRQRADRPRPPEAPVPALLALQEARHLPQHAAVVHRHGPADRRAALRVPSPLVGEGRGGGIPGIDVGGSPHP